MPEGSLSSASKQTGKKRRRPRCKICKRRKKAHQREGCPFGPPGGPNHPGFDDEVGSEVEDDGDYEDEDEDEDSVPLARAMSAPVRLRSAPALTRPQSSSVTALKPSQPRSRSVAPSVSTRCPQTVRLGAVKEDPEDGGEDEKQASKGNNLVQAFRRFAIVAEIEAALSPFGLHLEDFDATDEGNCKVVIAGDLDNIQLWSASIAPEHSAFPLHTKAPEASAIPLPTKTPEATAIPLPTKAPEATVIPLPTTAPEATAKQPPTHISEATTIPVATEASEGTKGITLRSAGRMVGVALWWIMVVLIGVVFGLVIPAVLLIVLIYK